jgi:7-cyano-7-deazaguanine tRNA-ribosyltransferase
MFEFYPKWAARGGDYSYACFWKHKLHNKVMISMVYLLERLLRLKISGYSLRRFLNIPNDCHIFIDGGGYTSLQRGPKALPSIKRYLYVVKKLDVNAYTVLDFPITAEISLKDRINRQLLTLKNSKQFLENRVEGKQLYGIVFGWDSTSIKNMMQALLKMENKTSFDGFAIGSLIPFAKDYYKLTELISTIRKMVVDRPLHAFGIGHVEGMYLCAALGVNSVDSTRYIIAGEFREYLLPQTGTPVYLGNFYRKKSRRKIRELPCSCPVCRTSTVEDLSKAGAENAGKIALHNLCVQINEARLINSALCEGWFENLLKQKSKIYRKLNKVLPFLLRLRLYEKFNPHFNDG